MLILCLEKKKKGKNKLKVKSKKVEYVCIGFSISDIV